MNIDRFHKFESNKEDIIKSFRDEVSDIILPLTDAGFLSRVNVFGSNPTVHSSSSDYMRAEIQLEKPLPTILTSDYENGIDDIKKMNDLVYDNIKSILKRLSRFGTITRYSDSAAIRGYIKIEIELK